jgi:hypothetical protein
LLAANTTLRRSGKEIMATRTLTPEEILFGMVEGQTYIMRNKQVCLDRGVFNRYISRGGYILAELQDGTEWLLSDPNHHTQTYKPFRDGQKQVTVED